MTASESAVTGVSIFVQHGPVRLHVLGNDRAAPSGRLDQVDQSDQPDLSPAPVVVVPGMGEYAGEYGWLLERLGDRQAVAVDLRGRGGSDAPPADAAGYSWEDHIADLRAVVEALGLRRPVLVAFSRGSSYALGYALRYPGEVGGLVVGDYWARHARPPDAAVERQLTTRIRGVAVADRMPGHAARAVFAQARDVPLWDRLGELRCGVLVIRGGRRGAVVTDEVAAQWREALPTVELATVDDAGHDLWSRDQNAYLAALLPFLSRTG
ncbi:alpha/beta fold hydrolase [Parafrankia sp. FMc2]|uniref:alpha/beta fold hydrolase n=1 Tax=Parafrankia sp. FMc2 TaxID=3233196 RepID=UPI0034D4ADF8